MIYIIIISLIIFDQISKYIAELSLKGSQSIDIIPSLFRFTYVENRGAAFGILQNSRWFFIIITFIITIVAIIYFEKKIRKMKSKMYNLIYILLISGAVGNLIDRILNGYVVDFLDFYIINYPVFNLADCYVCIGCVFFAWSVFVSERRSDGQKSSNSQKKTD